MVAKNEKLKSEECKKLHFNFNVLNVFNYQLLNSAYLFTAENRFKNYQNIKQNNTSKHVPLEKT